MNKKITYILLSVLIPLKITAQNIVPVKSDAFLVRESVDSQFRSPQADLIKERGFNPYSLSLKPVKSVNNANKSGKVKSGEQPTAHFVASAGRGYFFESFESAYAGQLPQGWNNYPSVANANNIAFHWQAFSPRIKGNPDLQNRMVMSIEGLLSSSINFDEMFESPEIEILPNSVLSFNVGFNPAYLCKIDYEKGTFDQSIKNADLEIRIKIANQDDYTTTFSLFEASKGDTDFQKMKYRSYSADLSSFAGKKIRFAFRYSGTGVPRIDLDNIGIERTDRQEITLPVLYNIQFTPLCKDADRYQWSFTNARISQSQEKAPVVCFSSGDKASVTLKIIKGNEEQIFTQDITLIDPLPAVAKYKQGQGIYLINTYESKVTPDGYLVPTDVNFQMIDESLFADNEQWKVADNVSIVGEDSNGPQMVSYLSSKTEPCPSLNVTNSITDSVYAHSGNLYVGGNYLVWNIENVVGGQNGKAMQGLGSNSVYKFEAVSEHYSRPLKDHFIGGVLLHFIVAQSTSDFTLTAILRGLDSGKELGKSMVPKSKSSTDGGYGAFFVFNFPSLIKVSEPFAIEISGIPNGENEKLFFVNQYFGINGGKPFADNTAYFKMNDKWTSASDLLGYATSLSISPLMISPVQDVYLKDKSTGHYKPYNSNVFKLEDAGGTLNIGTISTFALKEKPLIDADWIRCSSLMTENNLNYMEFTYDACKDEGRQAIVCMTDSLGNTKKIMIRQGNYSGISTMHSVETSVLRNGDKIVVRNLEPSDHRIIIYDISGRMVGESEVALASKDFEYSIFLSKGIYLVQVIGDRSRTYKL